MKVHIEDNLYLESDERNYTIKEYSGNIDKQGNETYKIHGYYATVQQAIKGFLHMKIKQSNASTLSELEEDVKRIERYIESKINM